MKVLQRDNVPKYLSLCESEEGCAVTPPVRAQPQL
jgi:hypothetical protein